MWFISDLWIYQKPPFLYVSAGCPAPFICTNVQHGCFFFHWFAVNVIDKQTRLKKTLRVTLVKILGDQKPDETRYNQFLITLLVKYGRKHDQSLTT